MAGSGYGSILSIAGRVIAAAFPEPLRKLLTVCD